MLCPSELRAHVDGRGVCEILPCFVLTPSSPIHFHNVVLLRRARAIVTFHRSIVVSSAATAGIVSVTETYGVALVASSADHPRPWGWTCARRHGTVVFP